MPTTKIVHAHRNMDRNPTSHDALPKSKPQNAAESYQDGEVGWGKFRAADSSISTVLDESSTASNLSLSIGAQKVRQLLKKHRNTISRHIPAQLSEHSNPGKDIAITAVARKFSDEQQTHDSSYNQSSAPPRQFTKRFSRPPLGFDNQAKGPSNDMDDGISYLITNQTNDRRSAGRSASIAKISEEVPVVSTTTEASAAALDLEPDANSIENIRQQFNILAVQANNASNARLPRSPVQTSATIEEATTTPKYVAIKSRSPHSNRNLADDIGPSAAYSTTESLTDNI